MTISIMKECYIPMWSWLELMPLCACLFILRWNQIVLWQLCWTLNPLSCKLLLQSTIHRQVLFINCEWHSHLQVCCTNCLVFASQVQWRLIRFLFSFGVWSSYLSKHLSLSIWDILLVLPQSERGRDKITS